MRPADSVPSSPAPSAIGSTLALGLMLAASIALPASLLWDFSWEATVGIDSVWGPPHVATYLAIVIAAATAVGLGCSREPGITLGRWRAPVGAWIVLWGAFAYGIAFVFDRWWQTGYGLAAGIWHPPQILKAAAFFAVTLGAWLCCVRAERKWWSLLGAGAVLALIGVVTLASNLANQQHSASFHQLSAATYPIVLVAASVAGRGRFSATAAALAYTLILGAMTWLLPLIPGSPQVAPVYQPRDHLLPPPFPLLLIAPALAIDLMLRVFPSRDQNPGDWRRALETGLAYIVVFTAVQWPFATFLLSPAADHWFFAGGGRHWPFFLRISPSAQTAFWTQPNEVFTLPRALVTTVIAMGAARLGLWLGTWMNALRR